MSTNATALPRRTFRPFISGAVMALAMLAVVIGIALALNFNARTAQPTSQKVAPVQIVDPDYVDHRAGVIVPVPAKLPDVTGCFSYAMDNCGSSDPAYRSNYTSDNGGTVAGAGSDSYFNQLFTPRNGRIDDSSDNTKWSQQHGR